MLASAMRATALSASTRILRDVPEGRISSPPASVTGYVTLLAVYIWHLNHKNPLVTLASHHPLVFPSPATLPPRTSRWAMPPTTPNMTSSSP